MDQIRVEEQKTIIRIEDEISIIRLDDVGSRIIRDATQGMAGAQGEPGLVWRGAWNVLTQYFVDDAVFYNGSSWRALTENIGITPVEGLDWTLIAQKGDQGVSGLNWQGDWSALTNYATDDVVTYLGSSWIALQPSLNVTPVAGPYWSVLAEKGDQGPGGTDTSAVKIFSMTVGDGTNLTFTIPAATHGFTLNRNLDVELIDSVTDEVIVTGIQISSIGDVLLDFVSPIPALNQIQVNIFGVPI